jgi:hypothetical protein
LTGNRCPQACEVFAQRLCFVLDGNSQTFYVVSNWGLGGGPVSGQAPGYPSEERVRFQGLSFLVEARYRQEKYRLSNRYDVIADKRKPLPCPVIHPGHAV